MKYLIYATAMMISTTQLSYSTEQTDLMSPQESNKPVTVNFELENWEINAKGSKFETYLGQPSLLLEDGKAVLKNVDFKDGVIEYDIAFNGNRGFVGSGWHIQNDNNFEHFYLRPHQSGNPDASQYTPVFNGMSGWQLYHGKGYSAPAKHSYNQWTHIKMVITDDVANIYIQDMEKPAITSVMQQPFLVSGGLSLVVGGTKAHYANFSYQKRDSTSLKAQKTIAPPQSQKNIIGHWQVSQAFDEKSLEGIMLLTAQQKNDLIWKELKTGHANNPKSKNNVANLAQIQGVKKNANTVFAKFILTSDKDQTKALKFGFSDRAKIYVNDSLMYAGDNTYRTRDYRYLGSIGTFDTVYLPLKKGKNEVWMAVSESFGGWGIMAQFNNINGITITP